jgi:beta propeller repeat protein
MSTVRTFLGALAILTVVAALAGNAAWPARTHAAGSMHTETVARAIPISRPGAYASSPAISGKLVVWWRWRSGGGYPRGDIDGKDLATGRMFSVTTEGTAVISDPAISGHIVVWQECRSCTVTRDAMGYYIFHNTKIYGKDISTGREFLVATPATQHPAPAISGSIVIWQDRLNGRNGIRGTDLHTGRQFFIASHRTGQQYDTLSAISGPLVVWVDGRQGGDSIYGQDLRTGREVPVVVSKQTHGHVQDPKISGPIVLWTDWNWNQARQPAYIEARDVGSGRRFPVTTLRYGHFNPQQGPATALSGHIVVWEQAGNLSSRTPNFDIYGKDLLTGHTFQITRDPHDQKEPAISGKTVVWQDFRHGTPSIYGATLGS